MNAFLIFITSVELKPEQDSVKSAIWKSNTEFVCNQVPMIS